MITKCQTLCERGGTAAAGIGVGFNGAGGDVTIYGGTVKASDRFVLKNADIDGSGNITKSDIDGVEKIIMQK